VVTSELADLNQILSRALNRGVTLDGTEGGHREVVESTFPNPWTPKAEEYWPDMEGLDYRDTVTDFNLPEGTFFDSRASADHGHRRPAPRAVSSGAFRGPAIPAQYRRGDRQRRERLR
jgi:hypothetical protein